ncbi:hypothetical protein [Kribbella sp.]|uniref:hypothetical protein n=1 Tax=Kribbella sp. TaxID=1871183 RepID=UPI002D3B45C7|nr:hypothetical protein [Kribbella sp.]HZX07822.1 hypothetical protein [Kribbella sp.]
MKFDKADAARALEQEQAVRDLVTQIEKASTELAEIAPELFRTNAAYGVFRRLGRAAEAQADFRAAAMAGMQRCNELPVDVFNGATESSPGSRQTHGSGAWRLRSPRFGTRCEAYGFSSSIVVQRH